MTPKEFAIALLHRLGYPASENNIIAVIAWEAYEGGHWWNIAKFNPLNTKQGMPGSYDPGFSGGAKGIQAYASWEQGVEATARTILTDSVGFPTHYSLIRDALQSDASPLVTIRAILKTPWGTQNMYEATETSLTKKANDYESQHGGSGGLMIEAPRTFGTVAKVLGGAVAVVLGLSYLGRKR